MTLPHGSFVPVELTWTMGRAVPQGSASLAFVHLMDGDGVVRRTFDHGVAGGWAAGESRVETLPLYHSAIGPALAAGRYDLVVGVTDGEGTRWPLSTDGQPAGRMEYSVASVDVPELDPAGSRFVFDDAWLPVEAGTDVQVVARRWLTGSGALEVSRLPQDAAELGLVLQIPAATDGLRLVLAEGADQASLLVTTDCSGFEAQMTGPGIHEIRVPVEWGTESCRLRFEPTFHLVELESLRRLAASLEQLGYR